MGRGGARPGAGRKKLTLAELVAARRFDSRNPTHRRLLLEEDVVGDDRLAEWQQHTQWFHSLGKRSETVWAARNFENRVCQLAREDP